MTTQTLPYEILMRFTGEKLTGAHYVEITRYIDDNGETITEKIGAAQPIPTELSEPILGAVNTAAIVRIAELEKDATAKAEELTALQTAHAEALAAKDAEREAAVKAAVEVIVPPEPADITIKAWQAKAVLSMQGLLEASEQIIDSLPEPQRTIVMSAWTNNADFPRSSQTILALAAELKLDDATLDAMFAAGAALAV